MKLKPLREYATASYGKVTRRAWRGLLVAASMTATSLGGCGPGLDSRYVDTALDQGDLDGTLDDCSASDNPAACQDGGDVLPTP
jgi:hypothetical protein